MPLDLDNHTWIFRKASAATADIATLMTPLSGKVFQIQEKLKQQKEEKKKTKDPIKLLQEDTKVKKQTKNKASGKSKAKAKAKDSAAEEVHDDNGKTDAEIIVHSAHGSSLTRDKYFVDCLVMAIRSAIRFARQRFGMLDTPATETPSASNEEIEHGCLVYTDFEMTIVKECMRHGLMFGTKGEHVLKKVYRKWSAMRPALQKHAIGMYEQAGALS